MRFGNLPIISLHEQGFTDVTLSDLSDVAKTNFLDRVPSFPQEQFLVGDFFAGAFLAAFFAVFLVTFLAAFFTVFLATFFAAFLAVLVAAFLEVFLEAFFAGIMLGGGRGRAY